MSARVYSCATVASVPSTETRLVTDAAQAGLIAGTVPTNGSENCLRRSGSTMVDAVLQAITTRSGRWVSISSPMSATTRDTSAGPRRAAIGKAGVVGDINEIHVRPRRRHLAINGKPAEARIEQQDGFARRHGATSCHEASAARNRRGGGGGLKRRPRPAAGRPWAGQPPGGRQVLAGSPPARSGPR